MVIIVYQVYDYRLNFHQEIDLPESVADHMYRSVYLCIIILLHSLIILIRMSMLAFMLVDTTIDKDKLIKICLLHDVAEAYVGDITPYDGVTKEEKRRLEEVI